MTKPLRRHPEILLTTLLTTLLLALVGASSGHAADAGCTLYASPAGSDGGNGSLAAPFSSPQRLADSLAPGQVGCFESGSYVTSVAGGVKVSRPGITLTAAPGASATLVGRLWIARGASGVTVSDLGLNGRNPSAEPSPVVNATETRFDNVDVTNEHTSICFILGSFEYGVAEGTVIEGSRIHDCGVMSPQNHDHGIYIENSRGAVIRNNWIFDNADRGIQLYPQAIDTLITGNVIDGNGQGVIFSSSSLGVSTGNRVESNVIADSRVRWNVESFWEGPVGGENIARNNCVWGSNPSGYYNQNGGVQTPAQEAEGFNAEGNIVAQPEFVNRAAGDLTLVPGSACAYVQAQAAPPPAAARTITEARVILHKHQAKVEGRAPLVLSGIAGIADAHAVEIVRWKDGRWHRFARRPLRRDGSFVVRKTLHGRPGAQRLKAKVRGLTSSRAVKVRLLPTLGKKRQP